MYCLKTEIHVHVGVNKALIIGVELGGGRGALPYLLVFKFLCYLSHADDISEARLRALWVQHAPKPAAKKQAEQSENGQSAAVEESEEAAEGDAESANGSGDAGEGEPEVDLYGGFNEEPFVQAAAQFNAENYHGILELLTKAIDRGKLYYTKLVLISNSYITGARDVWHLLHQGPRALAPDGRGQ